MVLKGIQGTERPGCCQVTCRDTKDVENGGRERDGERETETVSQVLKSSIGD